MGAQQPKRTIKGERKPVFYNLDPPDAYLYNPENGTRKSGTRIITVGISWAASRRSQRCAALCMAKESAALVGLHMG